MWTWDVAHLFTAPLLRDGISTHRRDSAAEGLNIRLNQRPKPAKAIRGKEKEKETKKKRGLGKGICMCIQTQCKPKPHMHANKVWRPKCKTCFSICITSVHRSHSVTLLSNYKTCCNLDVPCLKC